MVETGARRARRTYAEVPEIAIFSGNDDFPARPVTIFSVELFAGETAGATMTIRCGGDEPLIALQARPGGIARFVPAAPAFIRAPLRVEFSGADAVGTVAFR